MIFGSSTERFLTKIDLSTLFLINEFLRVKKSECINLHKQLHFHEKNWLVIASRPRTFGEKVSITNIRPRKCAKDY